MNILIGPDIALGTPLLRKYITMINPYLSLLHKDIALRLAAGLIFFYGCLFYIMHFPGWGAHIEDIFLYNLLYILVDHYIDEVLIHPDLKHIAIIQMGMLIINPSIHETMKLVDPVLKTIAITYERLLIHCPAAHAPIIKLFKAEIEGLSIQKTGNETREQYYAIATKKGGYTMQVLQSIVGNTDPTIAAASFHIGTIMQLIDDSLDVNLDTAMHIHTIATHEIAMLGNLDLLWFDISEKIMTIDPRFNIFKIFYSILAVYLPDHSPVHYSKELMSSTHALNIFDCHCDLVVLLADTIHSELMALEILAHQNECGSK